MKWKYKHIGLCIYVILQEPAFNIVTILMASLSEFDSFRGLRGIPQRDKILATVR